MKKKKSKNAKNSKKPRRSKYTHISLAAKAAWIAFAIFIKYRDNYTCITCGRRGDGQAMHAGHFISRTKSAIKFHPANVHAQCAGCNLYKNGAWDEYYVVMQTKYGQEVIDELMKKKDEECKRSIQDYLEIEKFYIQQLKELQNEREGITSRKV